MLSISEKTHDYAMAVTAQLNEAGIRAEANTSADKIGAKIREALMAKTPLLLTVGEREMQNKAVSVRPYYDVADAIKGDLSLESFIAACKQKIDSKWHATTVPQKEL